MVIQKQLTDFGLIKNSIINKINYKKNNNLFSQNLHYIFKNQKGKSELAIIDTIHIIESIERKLRHAETIYYTYFETSYENNVLINSTLTRALSIDTEFSYDTKVIKSNIIVNDPNAYIELIKSNFQTFILLVASLYENLCKLIETLLKKITVHEGQSPYQSITLTRLMKNWDNLVELGYKDADIFYRSWLSNHRPYFMKYLAQINSLRNSFIHGYSSNLRSEFGYFMVTNFDLSPIGFPEQNPKALITDLIANNFVSEVMLNTQRLTSDLLASILKKLNHAKQKIPM